MWWVSVFLHYTTSRPDTGIDNTVKNKYIYTKVVDSLPEAAESPSETSMKTLPFSLYLREDQFPIVARRMAGLGRAVPVHDHEFTELVVVTRGFLDHEIDGAVTRLVRGDFFLLHPGKRHSYPKSSKDSEIYNVLYDARVPIPLLTLSGLPLMEYVYPPRRLEEDRLFSGVIARLPPLPLREVRGLLEAMIRESASPGASRSLLLGSLFSAVAILLARQNAGVIASPKSSWRLNGVVNYMQCHLSERLRIDKLAALAAMSPSTLLRTFNATFGCGPAKYFASLRLSHAVDLLKTTDLTIREVAYRTGFFDDNHLRKKIAQTLHFDIGALRAT